MQTQGVPVSTDASDCSTGSAALTPVVAVVLIRGCGVARYTTYVRAIGCIEDASIGGRYARPALGIGLEEDTALIDVRCVPSYGSAARSL